jgi:hypothetical protein
VGSSDRVANEHSADILVEGDVEGVMEKPVGDDEASKRAREKWYIFHPVV